MDKIFAFCNQKGGVGKTTSVINISAVLAKLGYKILIVDMDSQANATSGLGLEKPGIESTGYQLFVENSDPSKLAVNTYIEGLYVIPSSADLSGAELELINQERREYRLREQLNRLVDQYDAIFIDCPPSLGLITINSLVACHKAIIPLQCEYYALEGLGQLLHTIQLVQQNLSPSLDVGSVLLTMADFRTNLTQQVIEEVRSYFKEKVFDTIIPRSVKLSEAPSFGKPAVFYDSSNKGSKKYTEVAHEFKKRFLKKEKNEQKQKNAEENSSPEVQNLESVANQSSVEQVAQN